MEEKTNFSKLLEKMPQDLTKLEAARWLYIELGKRFRYNMNVFYISEEKLGEIYNEDINIDEDILNENICKPINIIYLELLKRIGVDGELKTLSGQYKYNHVGAVLTLDDGLQIYTDLTVDLYCIQKSLRTNNFGYSSPEGEYDILSRRELKKIDDKIGYTFKGLYMNDFIDLVAKEMQNDDTIRKYLLRSFKNGEPTNIVSDKFEFLLKQIPFEQMGYVEARNFLIYLIQTIFKPEEKSHIEQYDLYREKEDPNVGRDFLNCIIIDENNEKQYYIQSNGKEIRKLDREKMEKLFESGWRNKNKNLIMQEER